MNDFRQGQKPLDTRKHEDTVAHLRKATLAGAVMDWSCHATTESESARHLHSTAATERS